MINNLFKYGFHDTDVNDIKIEGNSIILYFDDGIYILDKFNNETNLSKPISMNIKIDNKYFKTIDVIEIREIFPKYRSLDFKALKKYLKNDKLGINNKYLLSLFDESYKSAFIVCEAIKNGCVSQAAVVLRLLLESSSIIRVLIDYPDLLEKYIKHFEIRLDVSHTPNKERPILENSFPNVESNKRLRYMDYGWFESKLEP